MLVVNTIKQIYTYYTNSSLFLSYVISIANLIVAFLQLTANPTSYSILSEKVNQYIKFIELLEECEDTDELEMYENAVTDIGTDILKYINTNRLYIAKYLIKKTIF